MRNLSDSAQSLHGCLVITARNVQTGKRELVVHSPNLVVDKAYEQLASLLGGDLANNHVTKLAFGSNGTAAASTDTGLTQLAPQVWLAVTATYPSAKSVLFTTTWAASVQNTITIREVGLFCTDNTLVARKAFQDIKKSTDWEWTIEWLLRYT